MIFVLKEAVASLKQLFEPFEAAPISRNLMHGPVTPEMIHFINKRNNERRKKSIELLGTKWLLHPDNREQRKESE